MKSVYWYGISFEVPDGTKYFDSGSNSITWLYSKHKHGAVTMISIEEGKHSIEDTPYRFRRGFLYNGDIFSISVVGNDAQEIGKHIMATIKGE